MGVAYIRKKKHTKLNEAGFTNPFDIDYQGPATEEDDPVFNALTKSNVSINGVSLWNTNTKNKMSYKNGKMYSNKHFCVGDIIEESPVKLMDEKALYSETIRDTVFPIDTAKGIYGLPLGYAVCYRNSKEAPVEGNISYEYDEDRNMIVFKAIKTIRPGNELVIDADDADFSNELKPDQFRYQQGVEPIYRTKAIKLV